jgi:hypothetical protein
MQNGDEAVDAVDVEATWQRLAARLGSQLIDVRTRAENCGTNGTSTQPQTLR